MSKTYRVAVLGATGAVGQELLDLLAERQFPLSDLLPLASSRSAGSMVSCGGREYTVQEVTSDSFREIDVAFFSAGAGRSREFAPHAMKAGALVVDNSSAFRMDTEVPLVIPEVNLGAIQPTDRLIANPNCSAIVMLMAVAPLRQLGEIDRVILSTYQSASGAGASAMRELEEQTRAVLDGKEAVPEVMPHKYAFNLFSHNTPINELGYNEEEEKVIAESRKILSNPDLKINVTCVRVPVLRAHSESITVEFKGSAPSEEEVRECLRSAPGVKIVDDRAGNTFPMPLDASGQDDVLVGRIRKDISHPSAISMFVSGDQIRKGAALNAIQIAEAMLMP